MAALLFAAFLLCAPSRAAQSRAPQRIGSLTIPLSPAAAGPGHQSLILDRLVAQAGVLKGPEAMGGLISRVTQDQGEAFVAQTLVGVLTDSPHFSQVRARIEGSTERELEPLRLLMQEYRPGPSSRRALQQLRVAAKRALEGANATGEDAKNILDRIFDKRHVPPGVPAPDEWTLGAGFTAAAQTERLERASRNMSFPEYRRRGALAELRVLQELDRARVRFQSGVEITDSRRPPGRETVGELDFVTDDAYIEVSSSQVGESKIRQFARLASLAMRDRKRVVFYHDPREPASLGILQEIADAHGVALELRPIPWR